MINKKSGFTLLEILLVIGIIAVLVGIVIVAINPSKTLATVRNTERKSDLKQIDSALSQYYIDYNEYPASLTSVSSLTEICDTGTASATTTAVNGELCDDLINLSELVPIYLTAIPNDPIATTTKSAGYKVIRTGRRISLSASGELGQTITRGADTYTVTYNGNGNTGGTIPSAQTKTENINLTLQTNSGTLVKTGYNFDGWNTLANGSGTDYAQGANYIANAGVTLFAKWTINTYTVTFNSNGGTGGSTATQTLTYNTGTPLTANGFTRTGYTFAGWATSASGAVAYANTASYTIGAANVTLFAKWTINTYTVTYDENTSTGGTVPSNQTKTHDVTLVLASNSGSLVKTGYTFAGWNTLANGSGTDYAQGANYIANAGVTLFAKWTVADACGIPGDPTDRDCWSTINSKKWGSNPSYVYVSTATTTFDGKANTATLYSSNPAAYPAAKYCYELTEGGVPVGTWYLPSYAELWTGYSSLGQFFSSSYFWSSTESATYPNSYAWMLFTVPGNYMWEDSKAQIYSIRCLR